MIYFDNAATTYPKPERVYKALDECARNFAVNVGRGQYELSDKASVVVEELRNNLLKIFNTKLSNVILLPSATIAINQILRGFDYSKVKFIYISPFEHNAVIRTLNYLKKDYDFEIKILDVSKNPFMYNLDSIKKSFEENNPDIVIVSHASNVCGAVAPVEQIFSLSKEYDATNVLDSAQSAGIIDIYFDKWNIDYLVFAGHKSLYGPFGIAGIIAKNSIINLNPIITGGSGFDSINSFMPNNLPIKFEAGSLNINAAYGLNESLKIILSEGLGLRKIKELKLLEHFKNLISKIEGFEIIGDDYIGDIVGVCSVVHDEYSPNELGIILNNLGIGVRTGMHCSPKAHEFFNTSPAGTVRFSFGYFNTIEEIDTLKKLEEVL